MPLRGVAGLADRQAGPAGGARQQLARTRTHRGRVSPPVTANDVDGSCCTFVFL